MTGKFDIHEAQLRGRNNLQGARDDDGKLLRDNPNGYETLEVTHIIPHSFTAEMELVSIRFLYNTIAN